MTLHLPDALKRGPIRTADVHQHTGVNRAIAVWITNKVGSMWTAYIFAAIALVSLPAALLTGNVIVIVAWVAQTFFQLVLLPVILVGQNVQAAYADRRALDDHEILTALHALNATQLEILTALHALNATQLEILNRLDGKPDA